MAYYAGPMVADVNNELQKLMQYVAPRREITLDDVERLVQQGVQYTVFEWVEQVATRQVDKAGRLLAAMRSDGEDALHVISLAARQFRLILKMQLMQQDGMQPAASDKIMGVPPFVARKVRAQARYFKPEETERALAKLLEAEWMIKSGQWRQSELALDMVLQSIMVRG